MWTWLRGPGRGIRALPLALGLLPVALWTLFSLIYYGSPVPNTALAKLNLDIPAAALLGQGLLYALDLLRNDPITAVLIVTGVTIALWRGGAGDRLAALGIALYLVYVLRIGGDFMAGRFFAAPAIGAFSLIASHAQRGSTAERKKLVMKADGALAQKLEAWKEVNKYYATAMKEYKGQWVPNVVMAGGQKGQNINAAQSLLDLFMVKTARDLSLDMTVPSGK